jgi:hypothetical protein
MLLPALVSFMMQKIPGQQVIWTDDTPTMFFDRNRCKQADSGHTSDRHQRQRTRVLVRRDSEFGDVGDIEKRTRN